MRRRLSYGILLLAVLGGCKPASTTPPVAGAPAPAPAPAPVVPNHEAKPGDVTTCPFSGRTFVVQESSPTLEHGGRTYVFCSEKARAAVAADPDRYLHDEP